MGLVGRARGDTLRLLFAVVVSARVLWRNHKREKPHASRCVAPGKWILVTKAVVTLWMGIVRLFITRQLPQTTQAVIDQVEPAAVRSCPRPLGSRSRLRELPPRASAKLDGKRPGTR